MLLLEDGWDFTAQVIVWLFLKTKLYEKQDSFALMECHENIMKVILPLL